MRKWLYCILLTAMVLPMVSCRRAVEKARRNIRLEAVNTDRAGRCLLIDWGLQIS